MLSLQLFFTGDIFLTGERFTGPLYETFTPGFCDLYPDHPFDHIYFHEWVSGCNFVVFKTINI